MREAVLQKVPSWAVDESVGRFERREKNQEEALCQVGGHWVDLSFLSV